MIARSLLCVFALLTGQALSEDFKIFRTVSSTSNPGDFKDGMPVYLPAEDKKNNGLFTGNYLLCSSCTVSYFFGTTDISGGTDD